MAKTKLKGGALLSPVPTVLVSCGKGEKANLITIGWTGIVATHPPRLYISVRPERYSYGLIEESGEFCVNLPSADIAKAVDFCGVRSGKDCDKFAETGLTKCESFEVECPSVAECPMTLECKVFQKIPLGSHDMFIADIVAVSLNEELMDKNGRIMLENANLYAYVHGDYFSLGKKLGDFGYSVRKKKTIKKRLKK